MSVLSLVPIQYKVIAALVILGAIYGGARVEQYVHDNATIVALKASDAQAAADQLAKVESEINNQKAVTAQVDTNAKTILADSGAHADSVQHYSGSSIDLCPVPVTASKLGSVTNGPAAAGSTGQPAGAAQSLEAAIPIDQLSANLEVGIDALNAELLWREWVREEALVQ